MKKATITGLLLLLATPALAEQPDLPKELHAIALTESTDGKYTNHALITEGLLKGTRAGGAYGMMPATVLTTLKWSRRLRAKYPELLTMNANQITEKLNKDRNLARDLAMTHWKRMRVYMNFSREKAAYCWLNGTWAEDLSRADLQGHWYVQRFLKNLGTSFAYGHASR